MPKGTGPLLLRLWQALRRLLHCRLAFMTYRTLTKETQMESFTLKRDGDRSLAFDGALIGEGSSRRGNAPRWFEVRIFKTAGNQYVIGGAGRTVIDGERDRCWAVTAADGQEVVRSLTRIDEDGVEYLTSTARDALTQASEADIEIRSAFLKRVA